MATPQIENNLLHRMKSAPDRSFDLLVRVDRVDDSAREAMAQAGLTVRRQIQLLPSFAVTGTGSDALRLLDWDWVQSIEEDQPVHTLE
jgi:hypothetical protein